MKIKQILWTVCAAVLVLLVVIPQSVAQEHAAKDPSATNVLMTFRIGTLEGKRKTTVKTYSLVVAEGTLGSKLLAGQRVPFPEASENGDMSKIAYQNIGFATEVRVWVLDKKTIKLMADIEDSRVMKDEDGGPPSVETRQVSINAILTDGEALEVTRGEGIIEAGSGGFVEVEAKILR